MDESNGNPPGTQGLGGNQELIPRPPDDDDLVRLCRRLNELGAAYLVVGGLAVIHAGYGRFTEDIDLIIDTSPASLLRS